MDLGILDPDRVAGLAGLAVILFWLIVGNVRGWYVPGSTHRREVASLEGQLDKARQERESLRDELTARMDNFRADHALRMDQAREDFAKSLEQLRLQSERELVGVRQDMAGVLAAREREASDWRGAYHIRDERANTSEDRMDEVLEHVRLSYALLRALDAVTQQRNSTQPPQPVNNHD